jgi:Flp pilus assembly protein TadD
MKQLLGWIVLTLFVVPIAWAEGPDDQYLNIYNLIQQADALSGNQPTQALAKYLQAQSALQKMQKTYPDWNAKVVTFRLNYLTLKVQSMSAQSPSSARTQTNAPPAPDKRPAPILETPAPVARNDAEVQLDRAHQQVRQLEADKVILEAKLKEALAAQPAVLDPRELANAQAQLKSLQKENELLKVSLARPSPGAGKAAESVLPAAEANRRLVEQTERANTLALERDALQSQLKALSSNPGTTLAALQAENALLKKQVAESRAAPAGPAAAPGSQLTEAQKQIAALQADREMLRLEKTALESRVRQLSGSTNAPQGVAIAKVNESTRVKQLEGERNQLQKKLDDAMKEIYGRKGKALSDKLEGMEGEILVLRSRLEVFEARRVPYTAEELALFNKPEPQLAAKEAAPKPGKKSTRDLPAGSTALIAEAQKYFSAKQFDKAEQNYLKVLSRDQTNVPTLANLAVIQMQLNRVGDAEKNIKQAVAIDPEDPYSLSVLGQIKFQQEKYDEALDALSRAAKIDPQNAQVQNLLGLTLSQKGLRGPAESALRKAIQIDPGFGDAHNNLAVIYLGQQPPLVELARWHYQKARAAGNAPNPFLEKAFESKKPAAGGP